MIAAMIVLACAVALSMGGFLIAAVGFGIVGLVLLIGQLPASGCNHNCRQGRKCEACELKRQAKAHYQRYFEIVGYMDCGAALAEAIRPDVLEHKLAFNNLMDRLAKIDPDAPKTRL